MKVVIIGLGAAGFAALSSIKRIKPDTEITVIDDKICDMFHPCGMPYSLEGLFPPEKLNQELFLEKMKIVKISGKALSADSKLKIIKIQTTDGMVDYSYDKLVIASGAVPIIPDIENLQQYLQKWIFTLTSYQDLNAVGNYLENNKLKNVTVIGGGAIGLETAFALKHRASETTVIEMKGNVLSGILDSDMASTVEEYLKSCGIQIITGSSAVSFNQTIDSNAVKIQKSDGQREDIKSDLCILSVGYRANSGFGINTGLSCDNRGIVVDSKMRTSADDIYAAGDCAGNFSVIDGKPVNAKLAVPAYKMGICAANNVLGIEANYRGTAGTFVSKIGDLQVSGTGYTTETALKNGFEPVSAKIKMKILPEYFSGNTELIIKIIADKKSRRLIGAQSIGEKGASERINIVSMALEMSLTLDSLDAVELAYCPAIGDILKRKMPK